MSWTEKISIRIARKIVPAGESYTVGQVSHGIEIFLWQVSGALFLVTVSYLLGFAMEAILLAACYMLLRNFTGGFHFASARACFLSGNALLLAAAFSLQHLPADDRFSSLLILASTLVGLWINQKHAPAPHTYVEIPDHIRRKNRKIILFLLFFGCVLNQFLVYFDYKQLGHAFSFAVLLQSILLHPWTYRVMGRIEQSFS